MSVMKNDAQKFKVVKLAANTPLQFTGVNEMLNVMLVFPDPVTNATITERSSTNSALDTVVPIERLVFNPSQVSNSQLTLDSANKRFTSTASTCVGYYVSAYHDKIECSADCIVMISGREDWKGY